MLVFFFYNLLTEKKREQHFTDESLIKQINIVLLYKLLSQEAKKSMSKS